MDFYPNYVVISLMLLMLSFCQSGCASHGPSHWSNSTASWRVSVDITKDRKYKVVVMNCSASPQWIVDDFSDHSQHKLFGMPIWIQVLNDDSSIASRTPNSPTGWWSNVVLASTTYTEDNMPYKLVLPEGTLTATGDLEVALSRIARDHAQIDQWLGQCKIRLKIIEYIGKPGQLTLLLQTPPFPVPSAGG
jgi:hypothetical protein